MKVEIGLSLSKRTDMILKCEQPGCRHDFQDVKYGHKMRVHNLKAGGEQARCTVCEHERSLKKTDSTKKKR